VKYKIKCQFLIRSRSKKSVNHLSLHRYNFNVKYNKQMQLIWFIYFQNALHVSGGSSAHHREHITVHTASGIVNQYCYWLVWWMRWNWVPSQAGIVAEIELSSISTTIPASNNTSWPYLKLCVQLCIPDDGRRNRLKHVERFGNK